MSDSLRHFVFEGLVPPERPRPTAFAGHTVHDRCCDDPDTCVCECLYCDCRYADTDE